MAYYTVKLPVKAALSVGKNCIVLLMMMRAFAPSAATASDATTTSGLGGGLGSRRQTKNRLSYLKIILCYFLPYICPHIKFHPNRTKNVEVKKNGYWRFWLAGPVSQKIAVNISNSFYLFFSPIQVPKLNLIKIGCKTQKLKRFVFDRLW